MLQCSNKSFWVLRIVNVEAGAQSTLQYTSRHEQRCDEFVSAYPACSCRQRQWSGQSQGEEGPLRERKALMGLESAVSEWCRQRAKLMGHFLVMPVEEVAFVSLEGLAWWERRLLWESTFYEKEMVWQKRWQSVNREYSEEGDVCGHEWYCEDVWYQTALFLSMINVISTKGTCLRIAFWNPLLKSSLSVADQLY